MSAFVKGMFTLAMIAKLSRDVQYTRKLGVPAHGSGEQDGVKGRAARFIGRLIQYFLGPEMILLMWN